MPGNANPLALGLLVLPKTQLLPNRLDVLRRHRGAHSPRPAVVLQHEKPDFVVDTLAVFDGKKHQRIQGT